MTQEIKLADGIYFQDFRQQTHAKIQKDMFKDPK